ncbi:hypothetical protein MNEG_13478, partial [Monoraphidium neglectum]
MYNTSSMALGGDGLALDSAVGSSDLVMRTLVLGWRSHSSETLPLDACYDRTPQQGGAEDRLAWASAVPPPGAAHGSDYVNAPLLGASDSSRTPDSVPVFVMLPLDTINAEGVFRYATVPWFTAALQLLANSGVHGVAVDVWWSAVERSPRVYNWAGYKQLLEVLRPTGLKLQAVLSFHACGGNVGDLVQIPLPSWVLQAGQQDPDIFFTDRPRQGAGLGQRNKEYVSFWADDEPVLAGRTPMQVGGRRGPGALGAGRGHVLRCYEEFMASFGDAFAGDLGGLLEEVVVGMGPCGELRYPSYVEANGWRFPGVGEFQCYDRRALASLAAAARERGHPEWGYSGPHDSGEYNSSPHDTGFFAPDGSWDSAYGDFFLSWYSGTLRNHGEKLLAAASRTLGRFQRPSRGGAAPAQPGSPLGRGAAALLQRLQQAVLSGGGAAAVAGGEGPFANAQAAAAASAACGAASPLDAWAGGGAAAAASAGECSSGSANSPLDGLMSRLGLAAGAGSAGGATSTGSGRNSCSSSSGGSSGGGGGGLGAAGGSGASSGGICGPDLGSV